MRWGIYNGERILPNPLKKEGVTCPSCGKELIPKCGQIKVWHWAHKIKDCDDWKEGETSWHLDWKSKFPEAWQEYVMIKNGEKHRADVLTKNKRVIEFQKTSISYENILKREKFYDDVYWVLSGQQFAKNLLIYPKKGYYAFLWKWAPETWLRAKSKIIIDMKELNTPLWVEYANTDDPIKEQILRDKIGLYKDKLFLVKKLYSSRPCRGWGKFICRYKFVEAMINGYPID